MGNAGTQDQPSLPTFASSQNNVITPNATSGSFGTPYTATPVAPYPKWSSLTRVDYTVQGCTGGETVTLQMIVTAAGQTAAYTFPAQPNGSYFLTDFTGLIPAYAGATQVLFQLASGINNSVAQATVVLQAVTDQTPDNYTANNLRGNRIVAGLGVTSLSQFSMSPANTPLPPSPGEGDWFFEDNGPNLSFYAGGKWNDMLYPKFPSTSVPTVAAGAQASSATLDGSTNNTDTNGVINITLVAVPTPGIIATLTFGTALSVNATSIVQTNSSTAAGLMVVSSQVTNGNTKLTIYGLATLVGNASYKVSYIVVK